MITTIIKEFGLGWLLCRSLYSAKLKLLQKIPSAERLFEHKVHVKRIDLLADHIDPIEGFIKSLPDDQKQSLIETADRACNGTIVGFSSVELSYGMPINWQLNPLTGKACDASAKWYRIADFDKDRGDIKAVWEISRFSHFVTFARAYLASGDRKYYEAFRSQLADWLDKNPYSYGANFKCGQECALRMMNALLAYNVFHGKGLTDEQDEQNLAELISRCYRKILANFFYAYRCIKNNHTISELAGMIIGAWCSLDTKTLKKAYKTLDRVIAEQFSNDGGYIQFSFNYQRLALQVLEYVLHISEKTGFSLSDTSVDRIKNSVLLLYQCQDETGDVPNYGFNDGALVFPVSTCGYRDYRPVLGSLYGKLFGKRLFGAGLYDEEALWFGSIPDKLAAANEQRKSTAFPSAGLFTLRDEHRFLMTVLNDYKNRPAHMDQLHMDLWIDGVNVLCDCGTYSYADEKGTALVLTGAHNSVKLDGVEQMNKKGAFLIYGRTKRCRVKVSEDEFFGKMHSPNGYTHERYIKKTRTGYEVYDTVTASEDVEYALILHTPCKVVCNQGCIQLLDGQRPLLTIKSDFEYEIKEGIRSLYYLCQEPISQICLKGKLENGTAKSVIKLDSNPA